MNAETSGKSAGKLRCTTSVIAVILFVFAAAFEFKAASYSYGPGISFQKFLAESPLTPNMIHETGNRVIDTVEKRSMAEQCHHIGLALAMLGFASISIGVGFSRSEP